MASYQSVVNINIIMKFVIGHQAFVSLCTTLPYSDCWAVFQYTVFTAGNQTFVILWEQLLYRFVVEVYRLGLDPLLWYSSPSRCHSENSDADPTGISWVVRKDRPQFCQCWLYVLYFVFWSQLLWHRTGAQFSEQQVLRDNFVQQRAGNLREMAADTVMVCAFTNVIHTLRELE